LFNTEPDTSSQAYSISPNTSQGKTNLLLEAHIISLMDYLRACGVKCHEKMTVYDKNERKRKKLCLLGPYSIIHSKCQKKPKETLMKTLND
jgi:hypothetical protein